ncbi:MAG: right-handed parallel beta-helix repeat-containing protein, partial [Candidatus Thorarchaeota archaeon]
MRRRTKGLLLAIFLVLPIAYIWRLPKIPHMPITISSNSDFSEQGWVGNGTLEDPYVLSGISIVSNTACVSIADTDVYFVIRDCYFSTFSTSECAIVMDSVFNGMIDQCEITGSGGGVRLDSSRYCIVSNMTINVSMDPICGFIGGDHLFIQNHIRGGRSLIFSTIVDCVFVGNTVIGAVNGLALVMSSYGWSVTENSFENCEERILISYGSIIPDHPSVVFSNNFVTGTSDDAIRVYLTNAVIHNNTITNNDGDAIKAEVSYR